nr:hypothetical protein Iba_scaffold31426CG0010 [Ipomoea batatas]GMD85646.1 hypothetical protein Iba_chr14aCG26370 [Ipomoea batatas]
MSGELCLSHSPSDPNQNPRRLPLPHRDVNLFANLIPEPKTVLRREAQESEQHGIFPWACGGGVSQPVNSAPTLVTEIVPCRVPLRSQMTLLPSVSANVSKWDSG